MANLEDARLAARRLSDRAREIVNLAAFGSVSEYFNETREAAVLFQEAFALDPQQEGLRAALDEALKTVRQWHGPRVEAAQAAVARTPHDVDAWRELSEAQELSLRPEEAVAAMREAVARSPGEPSARLELMRLLAACGDDRAVLDVGEHVPAGAQDARAASMQAWPDSLVGHRARLLLALAQVRVGLSSADDVARTACAAYLESTAVGDAHPPEEFVHLLRRSSVARDALTQAPVAPDARRRAASGLSAAGFPNEAVAVARVATATFPSDATAWRTLAHVLDTAGLHAEALGCWRRLVELAPDDISARLSLQRAESR